MSRLSQAEPCDTLGGTEGAQRRGHLLMEDSAVSPLDQGGAHLR